jgi:hypothetical protein
MATAKTQMEAILAGVQVVIKEMLLWPMDAKVPRCTLG